MEKERKKRGNCVVRCEGDSPRRERKRERERERERETERECLFMDESRGNGYHETNFEPKTHVYDYNP